MQSQSKDQEKEEKRKLTLVEYWSMVLQMESVKIWLVVFFFSNYSTITNEKKSPALTTTIQQNIKNKPVQLVLNVHHRNKGHPPQKKYEKAQTNRQIWSSCVLLGKFKHLFRHFTGSLNAIQNKAININILCSQEISQKQQKTAQKCDIFGSLFLPFPNLTGCPKMLCFGDALASWYQVVLSHKS